MVDQLSIRAPRGAARAFDPAALLAEWRLDMAERVEAGEMATNTAETYGRGMGKFWEWYEGQETYKTVGPRCIRAWLAGMKGRYSPATVAVRLAGVRAFFAWAVAEAGLAYNPAETVKGPMRRGKGHKRDALTDAEVLRVLDQPDTSTVAGKRAKAMLCIMAYTGARVCEVQRAKVGDLRSNGKLKLYVHGKGRIEADEVLYLVHPDVIEATYDWLAVHPCGDDPAAPLFCGVGGRNRGGSLTSYWIRSIVKSAYRDAGIRDARKTTHSLRHSLVTNLIRHKVPPTKIMTVTRHKSLDTLLAYAHEVDRDDNPAESYVNYRNGD